MNRQQTTHRVSRCYDDTVECFVRDDAGPVDLTGKTLTASIRHYSTDPTWGWDYALNYGHRVLTTSVATQGDVGTVTFPLTADQMRRMYSTLYRFDIDADGQRVYTALLEIE
jgi:hypothetical protein